MIALDTNILVRIVVEDDPPQRARVATLMKKADDDRETFFVSDIVVCELVWVLQTSYRRPRADIGDALRDFLRLRHFVFSAPERLARALSAYQRGHGDFADYLIREHATAAGCKNVVTFDRALLNERGFAAPPA